MTEIFGESFDAKTSEFHNYIQISEADWITCQFVDINYILLSSLPIVILDV